MLKQAIEQELAAGREFLNWINLDSTVEFEFTDVPDKPLIVIGNYLLFVVLNSDLGSVSNSGFSWKVVKGGWPKPIVDCTGTLFAQDKLLDALIYVIDAVHQEVKDYAITQYENMRK